MRSDPPKADEGRSRVALWDAWLGVAVFLLLLCAGLAAPFFDHLPSHVAAPLAYSAAAIVALVLISRRVRRVGLRTLRAIVDRIGVADPEPMTAPWVCDGDTIEDRATNRVYRLANIDAPETGDFAMCYHERTVGERAKRFAIGSVRRAKLVSVRRTWRRDRYKRFVAYVFVDGVDLGELLMAQGLARPWRGWRPPWCGPKGPLARLAADRGESFSCGACRNWRYWLTPPL
ncbi:MAG: thermonuclease family protein [Hyphomonadaceae bacterium]|nr:thermonuclease family protein [Hyphomonadaceae bacterium]